MEFNTFKKLLMDYEPHNEQEAKDKELMLQMMETYGKKCLSRECVTGHFTASAFVFNKERTKVLMCEHIIDKSLTWLGGHADGCADMLDVVTIEIGEEAGIESYKLISKEIAALTVISIPGHVKNGKYVSSHLHLDVAFVFEADENEELTSAPDENTGLYWLTFEEMREKVADTWKIKYAYEKLIEQYAL